MTHHSRDLSLSLQELNDLGLVGGLHTGKQAGAHAGGTLILGGKVVKLAAGEGHTVSRLVLAEHANAAADSLSGSLGEGGTEMIIVKD